MPETARPINKIEAARARLNAQVELVAETEARVQAEAFPEPANPARRGFMKLALIGGGAVLAVGVVASLVVAWRRYSGASLRADMNLEGRRRPAQLDKPKAPPAGETP